MVFGVYLVLSLGFGLIGLGLLLQRRGRQPGLYVLYAAVASLAILVIFSLLSFSAGLIKVGAAYNLNIPQDYLSYGLPGLLILAVGFVGIVSPMILALIWTRRSIKRQI